MTWRSSQREPRAAGPPTCPSRRFPAEGRWTLSGVDRRPGLSPSAVRRRPTDARVPLGARSAGSSSQGASAIIKAAARVRTRCGGSIRTVATGRMEAARPPHVERALANGSSRPAAATVKVTGTNESARSTGARRSPHQAMRSIDRRRARPRGRLGSPCDWIRDSGSRSAP
jgi:hypothetical protein